MKITLNQDPSCCETEVIIHCAQADEDILRLVAMLRVYQNAMFIYLFFCLIYGNREVPTALLWGLFWVSAAGSLIQGVCFSDWIIKKLRYTWRSLLFVLFFLPVLTLAAWKTEWFPADQAGAWVMFVGIFLLIFLVMTLGFDIYFQVTGRRYDGLIGQYRRKKEEDERT